MKSFLAVSTVIVLLGGVYAHAAGEENVFNGSQGRDWDTAANWNLGRVPGAVSADEGIVSGNLTADVTTDFTGVAQWTTIIRGNATLNIEADFLNSGLLSLGGRTGEYGFLNQTAGRVNVTSLSVGDPTSSSVANSVYTLSGGTLTTAELAISSKGLLDIDGGTFSIDKNATNVTTTGAGLIKLQSGTFNSIGSVAEDLIMGNNVEISGGTVDLSGTSYFDSTFKVIGASANISMGNLGSNQGDNADFVFEMGINGISAINVAGMLDLGNATITVDGSAYTGDSGSFTLFNASNLSATSTVFNVANFPAEISAYVIQNQDLDTVTLELIIPGFDGWIGGYGLSGDDAAWDYDYDGDGEINFYEYGFGGDPTNAAVLGYACTGYVVDDGGTDYYEYVYARRSAPESKLLYRPQFWTSVNSGEWSGDDVVELPVTGSIDLYYESVTNRVDMTDKPTGFMRVLINALP